MNNKDSIILLSGGLDSLVTLAFAHLSDEFNPKLALTFNYGQKSADKEIEASKKIADFYGIKHEIITLDWLKNITKTGLVSDLSVPTSNLMTKESASQVWVPNRNALFLNIAASFADANDYRFILYGANKDEGENFLDNTELFRSKITELFAASTLVKPKVIAPLINYSKDDIVKIALERNIPLELVRSCYNDSLTNCGKCESCLNLKKALINNKQKELIERLFENEN